MNLNSHSENPENGPEVSCPFHCAVGLSKVSEKLSSPTCQECLLSRTGTKVEIWNVGHMDRHLDVPCLWEGVQCPGKGLLLEGNFVKTSFAHHWITTQESKQGLGQQREDTWEYHLWGLREFDKTTFQWELCWRTEEVLTEWGPEYMWIHLTWA